MVDITSLANSLDYVATSDGIVFGVFAPYPNSVATLYINDVQIFQTVLGVNNHDYSITPFSIPVRKGCKIKYTLSGNHQGTYVKIVY